MMNNSKKPFNGNYTHRLKDRHFDSDRQSNTLIYYFAFGLNLFVYGLSRTNFDTFLFVPSEIVVNIGRIICVLLLLTKLFTERFSKKQLIGIMIIGALLLASWYYSRDWNIVLLFFFIVAARDISIRTMAAVAFPIQLMLLMLTVSFSSAGVIESTYIYRYVDGALQLRSSLGYVHPNSFGQSVLSVCTSFAVLRFKKMNLLDLVVYSLALYACYSFADSRTTVVCLLVVIILSICIRIFAGNQAMRRMSLAACIVFVGMVAFSIYMMLHYNAANQWMNEINGLMSTRFSFAHDYYAIYPPTLFGRRVGSLILYVSADYTQYGPDNAYVRMLLQDGALVTFVYLLLYAATLIAFYNKGKFDECTFGLLLFSLAAVMESYSLGFGTNYFLVSFICVVYGWQQYEQANTRIGKKYFKNPIARKYPTHYCQ